jgi:predicted RNA binding protein YcfA (HicA-like mRNA interferase family)
MRIPRGIAGAHLVEVLCRRWDYKRVHQVGSHVILETQTPSHHRIAVPNHHAVRLGTLIAILRAVSAHKGVSRDDVTATL